LTDLQCNATTVIPPSTSFARLCRERLLRPGYYTSGLCVINACKQRVLSAIHWDRWFRFASLFTPTASIPWRAVNKMEVCQNRSRKIIFTLRVIVPILCLISCLLSWNSWTRKERRKYYWNTDRISRGSRDSQLLIT